MDCGQTDILEQDDKYRTPNLIGSLHSLLKSHNGNP